MLPNPAWFLCGLCCLLTAGSGRAQVLPPRAPLWQEEPVQGFLDRMEELRRRDDCHLLLQELDARLPEDLRDPRWLSLLGDAAWRAGQLQRAVEVWQYLDRVAPTNAAALAGLSRWDSLRGRSASALATAEQAVRVGPRDPRAWESLALARWVAGREGADQASERAVQLLEASEVEDSPLLRRSRHWRQVLGAETVRPPRASAPTDVPERAVRIPYLDPGDGSILLELFLEERQILAWVDLARDHSARTPALALRDLPVRWSFGEGTLPRPALEVDEELERILSPTLGMEVSLVLGRDAFPGDSAPVLDRRKQQLILVPESDR